MRWMWGIVALACLALFWMLDFGPDRAEPRRTRSSESPSGSGAGVDTAAGASDSKPAATTKSPTKKRKTYTVSIQIVNQNGVAVAGLPVALQRKTKKVHHGTTGYDGFVVFPGVRSRFLIAVVDNDPVGLVRPRTKPRERFEVAVRRVRLEMRHDGQPRVPQGFVVEGTFALKIDAESGTVEGFTTRQPRVVNETFIRQTRGVVKTAPSASLTARAPGYWPVTLRAFEQAVDKPLHGVVEWQRGVEVLVAAHDYIKPYLFRKTGGRAQGGVLTKEHATYRYYLKPGEYELRSLHLGTLLARFAVPDIYQTLRVDMLAKGLSLRPGGASTTPLPTPTRVRVNSPSRWSEAKLQVVVNGETKTFSATVRHIVLPAAIPVEIGITHPTLLSDPARVVQGPLDEVELSLRRGPLLRLSSSDSFQGGAELRIFDPGKHERPTWQRAFRLRRETDTTRNATGQLVHRTAPAVRGEAVYSASRGVYDVFVIPDWRQPVLLRGVRLDGGEVDLGVVEFPVGVRVVVAIGEDEPSGVLRATEPPYYERTSNRTQGIRTEGGRVALFFGCRPGPHEWISGDTKIQIDIPDAEQYEVPR